MTVAGTTSYDARVGIAGAIGTAAVAAGARSAISVHAIASLVGERAAPGLSES